MNSNTPQDDSKQRIVNALNGYIDLLQAEEKKRATLECKTDALLQELAKDKEDNINAVRQFFDDRKISVADPIALAKRVISNDNTKV
jgi:hypothetical protein